MAFKSSRFAPYTTQCRSQLKTINERDQVAFKRWMTEYTKDGASSRLEEIPSSQIPPKSSVIDSTRPQIFAVIDTCSIVKHRNEFVNFLTNLRRSYTGTECPVKFLIPYVVLEELDKCNRPIKKKGLAQQKQNQQNTTQVTAQQSHIVDKKPPPQLDEKKSNHVPIEDLLSTYSPPRLFMRLIEEELRVNQLLIGDLDPWKRIKLPDFEIVNHDDRILESSLRAMEFVSTHDPHPETRVLLITEDNIFKAKASTFQVASFRWREFEVKYRNFGRRNCVSTPIVPKILESAIKIISSACDKDQSLPECTPPGAVKPFALSVCKPKIQIPKPKLGEQLSTKVESRSVKSVSDNRELNRRTSLKIKATRFPKAAIIDSLFRADKDMSAIEEIAIVKEVINLS